jgi:hypothetical protein
MMLFRIFGAGVVFLFVTILINAAANSLKLTSWYTYLSDIGSQGIVRAFAQLSVPSMLWLFVGYPIALGTLVYILRRLF